MKYIKPVLCILSFLIYASCDPAQSLGIINRTNSNAVITFHFKENSQQALFPEFGKSDTLLIELDTTAENSSREYFFGLGTWKVLNQLDSLISIVDFIELETGKSKQVFQGEKQIRKFFEDRITSRRQERIEIIIE